MMNYEDEEEKQFLCAWGHGYIDAPFAHFIKMSDIIEDNGWSAAFITRISLLHVYETANCSDLSGELFVTRVI